MRKTEEDVTVTQYPKIVMKSKCDTEFLYGNKHECDKMYVSDITVKFIST